MYNPPEPTISLGELPTDNDDFEFIELMNVGDIALDLTGVSFVQGITFDFQSSAITTLEPNETVLIVKDQAAFVSRYGGDAASRIAGEYSGRFNNAGEVLQLEDVKQGTIAMIDYEDTWEPETDGSGYSLILIHPRFFDPSSWNSGDAWRSSVTFGGSPGWGDSAD